jgi:chromosome partitioning protein
MITITLLNEKGGVGKTTLATHIAAGLALRGKSVMLIDADPQGTATSILGLNKEPVFHDLIVRNAKWKDAVRTVHPDVYSPPESQSEGKLFAIPSNVETRNIANTISDGLRVYKRLQQIHELVDYVIFDTSPTPSLLHSAVLMATDYLLLPTECELFSFEGIAESMVHSNAAKETAAMMGVPPVKVLGIIPTMYRANTVTHSTALEQLKARYGNLIWEPIHNRIIWPEASINQQLIFGFAPDSAATKEMMEAVDRIEETIHERQA